MSGFEETLKEIALKSIKMNPPEQGDYLDENGILICGKCNTPRSIYKEFFGEMHYLPITCECRKNAKEKEQFEKRVERIRESSGIPKKYINAFFETIKNDHENERSITIMKRYVDKFSELYTKNQGLIVYGGVGTGKTHMAACIANGIINQGYSVLFVSLAELLQKRTYFDNKQNIDEEYEFMERIESVSLLIIDDLGTERGTGYALEFVYNVINTRCNVSKPIIVTTNMDFYEMLDCSDVKYSRIYNRLFESCSYPVEFKGKSKRIDIAADKNDEMNKILEVDYET